MTATTQKKTDRTATKDSVVERKPLAELELKLLMIIKSDQATKNIIETAERWRFRC